MENRSNQAGAGVGVGFGSKIGFILSTAGSAIGLGNLWAFPNKVGENGGAAFVLLYLICVLVIGVITMVAEMTVGKRAHANNVSAFKSISKQMGWVGLLGILASVIVLFYYAMLGGFTVKFAFNSFEGNTGKFAEFAGNTGESVLFTAIFIGLSVFIIMGGVKNGIERASKILMPILFVILLGTTIYSLLLGEGVEEGLEFYLKPDFSKITGATVLAAMSQAFYSLSLGMGIIVSYGSYAGKEVNLVRATASVCLFDTVIALLSGLTIFPAMFHYSAISGKPVSELGMGGMSLMFETMPLVFEDMGMIGKLVSTLFFTMVAIAAITSVIALFEVPTQFFIQTFHRSRKNSTAIIGGIVFLFSIPVCVSLGAYENGLDAYTLFGYNYFKLLDTMINTIVMPICAFFICICVGWILNPRNVLRSTNACGEKDRWFPPVFGFMVRYLTPLMILLIQIFGALDLMNPENELKKRAFDLNGMLITLLGLVLIALMVAVYFLFLRKRDTGTNLDEKEPEPENEHAG